VAAEAEERAGRAREQMVRYVGSQQKEMIDILNAPDTAQMPVAVTLASLTLPPAPAAAAEEVSAQEGEPWVQAS